MCKMVQNLEFTSIKAFEVVLSKKKVNSASKLCTAVRYMYM